MRLFIVLSSVFAVGLCVGGYMKQDPTEQQWCESLGTLSRHVNSLSFENGCPQIVSVYTQVVSGMNYIIKYKDGDNICTLKYYVKLWDNTYTVNGHICAVPARQLDQTHAMPGGNMDQDPTDPMYTDLLFNFTDKGLLNQASMNGLLITKVQSQVVAGVIYKYTIQMGSNVCHLSLFEQSWTDTFEVSTDTCHLASAPKRQLGGGWTSQDATEQQYADLLANFNTKGLLGDFQTCKIISVDSQVVSGMNYKYHLNCAGHNCHLQLYVQSWTGVYTVHTDTCTAHKVRQLGGWHPVTDTNLAGYQECIKATVEGINSQSNSMYRMVESNVHAKYQVVSGMKYDITVTAVMSTCMNNADSVGKLLADCPMQAANMLAQSTWHAVCGYQAWNNPALNFITPPEMMDAQNPKDNGPAYDVNMSKNKGTVISLKKIPDSSIPLLKTVAKSLAQNLHDGKYLAEDGHDQQIHGKTLLGRDRHDYVTHMDRSENRVNVEQLKGTGRKLLAIDDFLDKAKDILGGGDDNDVINHVKDLIEQNGPELVRVGVDHLLQGDENELVNNLKDMLGKDGHDLFNHGKNIGQIILGGDDHDKVPHGNGLLGGDDHDKVPHGTKMLGGDDHDKVPHGTKMLGGDDHDKVPHGNGLLGGDDHDKVPHGTKMLGGDDHDKVPHGTKMLGGDDNDKVTHGTKMMGGDDHDKVPHGNKMLGGDDHDKVSHGTKMLGGDDHDKVSHGTKMLGGDDHDKVSHGTKMLGGDDHDKVPHGTKMLGGDGHDDCHIGMFKDFKKQFNKLYGSQKEEEKRYQVFCDNMRAARKLQQTEKGSARYGATKFADLTKEEFKRHVGKRWDTGANWWMKKAEIPGGPVPDSFDWRDHGAVTPVKNQGSCGSCWAFSTTGNIEGQWAIKKRKLVSLSEQELVDCDKVDEGCNGGLPSNAYKEIERLGGLETETDYKYEGHDESCHFNRSDVRVYINDSVSISSNETEMAAWLAKNGPISIGINAFAMQFYMGGISHPWKIFCNPGSLDHGVLIVGYGVHESEPYWIVKNSWGPDWGEKGYYLVYRGGGVCGLNTMCTSAVVG